MILFRILAVTGMIAPTDPRRKRAAERRLISSAAKVPGATEWDVQWHIRTVTGSLAES
jgi:hypothetical protein